MSSWVRLWEDMPDDPKWLVIRHRASQSVTGVTVGHVVSVFVKMLTNADKNGDLQGWDDEDVAARLEYTAEQVSAIREAMQGKVLNGNHLNGWNKRQPEREDSSAVRMRASRARRDAERRNVTQRDTPEEKRLESDPTTPFGRSSCAPARATTTTTKKRLISENEVPNEQHRMDAERFGLNTAEALEVEWQNFADYNLAKGSTLADWNAAWRRWLEKGRGNKISKAKPLNGHDNSDAKIVQIFFERGTPQWNAWERFYRESKGCAPPHHTRKGTTADGWFFPTEYPPGMSGG